MRSANLLGDTLIGEAVGGTLIGGTVYELERGQAIGPYHYEYGAEEWLLVVSGRPTLRVPDGERELRPGDVACFPEGPAGAHAVRNDAEEPARVLMLSSKSRPAVAVYPESRELELWTGNEVDDGVFVRGRR